MMAPSPMAAASASPLIPPTLKTKIRYWRGDQVKYCSQTHTSRGSAIAGDKLYTVIIEESGVSYC